MKTLLALQIDSVENGKEMALSTLGRLALGLGAMSLLLGVVLLLLGHRTLGIAGSSFGTILVIGGILSRFLSSSSRKPNSGPYQGGRARVVKLSGSNLRFLLAAVLVLFVGLGTFYGTSFLASQQGGTIPPGGIGNITTSSLQSLGSTTLASTVIQTGTSSGASTFSGGSTSTPKSVSLVSLNLHAGTATSANSQGTASIMFVLHNNGTSTAISSILLVVPDVAGPPAVYQCASPSSCSTISVVSLAGNSTTSFTTDVTGFFFGDALTASATYQYSIVLADGQTIPGSAVAQG